MVQTTRPVNFILSNGVFLLLLCSWSASTVQVRFGSNSTISASEPSAGFRPAGA